MTVAPKKALGQHFLVDENILGVIERLSDLHSTDVVLEIGPGLGILTRRLAERARFVHAIELDRSLEAELRAALSDHANVRLVWGDALKLAIEDLEPVPIELVANLPYNVATPLVVDSLEHARSLQRWCVMVQREVADRFFAEPRTKAYGAVSVLVQLSAGRSGFHPVSPSVFRPQPRVDSALVAFERDVVAPISEVRPAVEAAFAHRRKTAANSIALSGIALRAQVEEALSAMGHPVNARAEESSRGSSSNSRSCSREPGTSVRRDQHLAPSSDDAAATASTKWSPCCSKSTLHDEIEVERADTLIVDGFAEDTIVREALLALADVAGVGPRWRVRIEKRIPVAAGLGGGSSDAATALRLANATLDAPRTSDELHRIAAGIGADVPFCAAAHNSRRATVRNSRRSSCRPATGSCSSCPMATRRSRPGRSTPHSTSVAEPTASSSAPTACD